MIEIEPVRTLTLQKPSRPGRPAYVSAASGLVRAGSHLYVVGDDENHLGIFPARGTQPGILAPILEGKLPLEVEARKRKKRDLESLARLPPLGDHRHGALLAFGSGSKRRRRAGVLLGLDAQGRLDGERSEIDLSPLYKELDDRLDGVNIEGAVVIGAELVLLQRGNTGDGRNARICLQLDRALATLVNKGRLGADALIDIEEVDLGAVGDVPLGFSDGAALPDGRMVFSAVAEDTSDSYVDGPCRGAAIGVLGRDGRVQRIEMIDRRYKVEGVEAALEGNAISVLLVTDADDVEVPASLLRCEIR
jgi:hypothetical protein